MKKIALLLALIFAVSLSWAVYIPYIPRDAKLGIKINFETLTKSPVFQQIKKNPKFMNGIEKFKKETGLEPTEIFKTAYSFADTTAKTPTFVVWAEAKISKDKLIKIIKENNEKNKKQQLTVKEITEDGIPGLELISHGDSVYLFFPGNSKVVAVPSGWKDEVVKAITSKAKSNNELYKYLPMMDSKTLAVAMTIPEEAKSKMAMKPMTAAFAKADKIVIGIDLSKYFSLEINFICKTPEDATTISNSINGFMMMGKMMLASKGLDVILNYLSVSTDKNTAKLTFSVTKSQAEELRKKIQSLKQAAPMPMGGPGMKMNPMMFGGQK